jgi:hypothetical protein
MLAISQQQAACHPFLLFEKSDSRTGQGRQKTAFGVCNPQKQKVQPKHPMGATIHPASWHNQQPTGATRAVTIAVT